MTDQLFTSHGYVKPSRHGSGFIRARRICQYAGCDQPHPGGRGRCYCDGHKCDFDTCQRMVRDRGRCDRHAYCKVADCNNMRMQTNAAKYCVDHATSVDYELRQTVPTPSAGSCIVCSESVTVRRPLANARPPLFVCVSHRHLRTALTRWRATYNLDDERIHELLDDPQCWVCTRGLGWCLKQTSGWGEHDKIAVDHDHGCCDPGTSCGKCVRGLAHTTCNLLIGQVERLMRVVGVERMHQIIDELHEFAQRRERGE